MNEKPTRSSVMAEELDNTPPITTIELTPSTPNGDNGWYTTPVNIKLTASDTLSGIKSINYKLNNGSWQTTTFSDTQNLIQNSSFETPGATNTGIESWELSVDDPEVQASQYVKDYAPGYEVSSALLETTGGTWHAISNFSAYASATPYDSMSASAWLKVDNAEGNAYVKIMGVKNDNSTYEIARTSVISGTTGWIRKSLNFTIPNISTKGVYLEIGLEGPGALYIDGTNINSSIQDTSTSLTVGSDSVLHTIQYYSVDNQGNTETYSCNEPVKNCTTFKVDQTPPSNWHDSGAFRQVGGPSDHHLYVFTNVSDFVSGLSTEVNKYQYVTNTTSPYGVYTDLERCNTPWIAGGFADLEYGVLADEDSDAYLQTQHTNFCNSTWRICKTVKFYAQDMAGNATTKNYCINGPWIKLRGNGAVKSNNNIDMLAEPELPNTDALVEVAGYGIDFFTSTQDWYIRNSQAYHTSYEEIYNNTIDTKTSMGATTNLPTTSGVFVRNGSYTLSSSRVPNNHSTATFNQVIFINGDLTISTNLNIRNESALLFVVSGDVLIRRTVTDLTAAIITNGTIYTAYDIVNTTATLNLKGFYVAETIDFQRTLQGTNNEITPSENFTYEPKYLVQLKSLFKPTNTRWQVN